MPPNSTSNIPRWWLVSRFRCGIQSSWLWSNFHVGGIIVPIATNISFSAIRVRGATSFMCQCFCPHMPTELRKKKQKQKIHPTLYNLVTWHSNDQLLPDRSQAKIFSSKFVLKSLKYPSKKSWNAFYLRICPKWVLKNGILLWSHLSVHIYIVYVYI